MCCACDSYAHLETTLRDVIVEETLVVGFSVTTSLGGFVSANEEGVLCADFKTHESGTFASGPRHGY